MRVYGLKDVKAGTFGPLLIAQNDGHMSRSLAEAFRGSQETVAMYPEDFELYELGEYSTDSGAIVPSIRFVCGMAVCLEPNGKV